MINYHVSDLLNFHFLPEPHYKSRICGVLSCDGRHHPDISPGNYSSRFLGFFLSCILHPWSQPSPLVHFCQHGVVHIQEERNATASGCHVNTCEKEADNEAFLKVISEFDWDFRNVLFRDWKCEKCFFSGGKCLICRKPQSGVKGFMCFRDFELLGSLLTT